MHNIMNETEQLAYTYLKAFGFEESEIVPVVAKGMEDLEMILTKLKTMLSHSPGTHSMEEMDDVLHALKGLLSHLGNQELSEKIEALRAYEDMQALHQALNELLF